MGDFATQNRKERHQGDGDPIDIRVDGEGPHGDLLVDAIHRRFRMIDGNQADDKIIAI